MTTPAPESTTTLLGIAKQPVPEQSRFAARARELATVLSRAGSVTRESVLGETA